MTKKLILSWKIIDEGIEILINKMKDKTFSGVYGVPRGGLIPAVILSHKLYIPLLLSPSNYCLIVDDVCDTGKTFDCYGRYDNNNITKACLFVKNNNESKVDFYYQKTDRWIVYPWEQNEKNKKL